MLDLTAIPALMTEQVYFSSVAAAGLSACLLYIFVAILNRGIPPENREYMDPLGYKLKLVWPMVRIIAYYFCTNLPNEYLERVDEKLQKTGVTYTMNAEQFVALQILLTFLMPIVTWLVLLMLDIDFPLATFVLAPMVGFFLPELWLKDVRKRRTREIISALPIYLDFITMAVEAGLNLSGALAQGIEKGPKGALQTEFNVVLRDVRSGLTRAEALRRMSDRVDVTEITGFVSSIIQAEKLGSSMAAVLRAQSEQRRNERFQRAEKAAMEAPVKLVFPLVVFIFPVTFVVLMFPIVVKFLAQGVI